MRSFDSDGNHISSRVFKGDQRPEAQQGHPSDQVVDKQQERKIRGLLDDDDEEEEDEDDGDEDEGQADEEDQDEIAEEAEEEAEEEAGEEEEVEDDF